VFSLNEIICSEHLGIDSTKKVKVTSTIYLWGCIISSTRSIQEGNRKLWVSGRYSASTIQKYPKNRLCFMLSEGLACALIHFLSSCPLLVPIPWAINLAMQSFRFHPSDDLRHPWTLHLGRGPLGLSGNLTASPTTERLCWNENHSRKVQGLSSELDRCSLALAAFGQLSLKVNLAPAKDKNWDRNLPGTPTTLLEL
jgi:hypothetical protein